MEKIMYPPKVDLSNFQPDTKGLPTKYGLPEEVKFCRSCIISNQRPNSDVEYQHTKASSKSTINFNEDQTCDAFAAKSANKKKSTGKYEKKN
jgi:hypothetical protein